MTLGQYDLGLNMFSAGPPTHSMSTKNLSQPEGGVLHSTQFEKKSHLFLQRFSESIYRLCYQRVLFWLMVLSFKKKKTFAFGTVRLSNEVFNRRVTICHMQLSVLDHSDTPLVLFRNLIRMHLP